MDNLLWRLSCASQSHAGLSSLFRLSGLSGSRDRTSEVRGQTSAIRGRRSVMRLNADFRRLASDLWPLISVLCSLTSGIYYSLFANCSVLALVYQTILCQPRHHSPESLAHLLNRMVGPGLSELGKMRHATLVFSDPLLGKLSRLYIF